MRSPRYYTSIVPSCIHKLEPYFWSGRIVDAGGAVAEHDLRDGSPVLRNMAWRCCPILGSGWEPWDQAFVDIPECRQIWNRTVEVACPSAWLLCENQVLLRQDLDRRAIVYQLPDFLDFLIRNRDRAIGPVMLTMCGADVPIAVWQAMDGDVTTRRNPELSGPRTVHRIRVGNVQRSMTRAPRISAVDDIGALGSAQVPFLLLHPRLASQRNLVSLQDVSLVHEFQSVFFLVQMMRSA
jgi:hypothetical protein